MADGDQDQGSKKEQEGDNEKKIGQYPVVRGARNHPGPPPAPTKMTDLPEDTKPEIIELITSAVERYVTDIQTACKVIKEQLDKLYGAHWNVIVGEAFGFDVTYLNKHILYMFFMGSLGILIWKNS